MPSLGTFGVVRPPLDLDFHWFGATIRLNPRASDLSFTEFMSTADGIALPDFDDIDEDNPTAEQLQQMATAVNAMTAVTKALQRMLREQIHTDDWPEFWRLAKENGQQNSDLLAVSKALGQEIAEHLTGFPTGPSSGSADTPSPMSTRSTGGSSTRAQSDRDRAQMRQRALARRETDTEHRHRVQDNAAKLLAGRPDLRLALWQQRKEQDAAEGLTG